MSDRPPEQPDLQVVQPHPTDATIIVAGVQTNLGPRVSIVFHHAAGQDVHFLEPHVARWLRDQLSRNVSGLVLPEANGRYTQPKER